MTATITTDGKRILADIPYGRGEGPRLAKRVPGARPVWDKSVTPNKFLWWGYPLSMDTCLAFRKIFGTDLVVLPPLASWARTEVDREKRLENFREEVASADLTQVKEKAPALYAAMQNRSYQPAGTGFLLASRAAILGDDPGLGKTLQALAAVIQSDAKTILVGCRRTATRTVWERETARWAPSIATYVAQGSRAERKAAIEDFWSGSAVEPGRRMLIINIEMIRAKREEYCIDARGPCPYGADKPLGHRHEYRSHPLWPDLFAGWYDAIILDESHNLLASTANIQSKRITQQRFGAVQLRKRLCADGLAIAMSGTPFRSDLAKAWGTLNWLRPDLFGSYWRWAETHFGVEQGRYGKVVGNGEKSPEPLDPEAWDRMLRPFYLKRTKAEAAPDLPPIQFAGTPIDPEDPTSPCYVQLEMEPEQARAYQQIVRDAEVTLDGKRLTATGVLAEITRKRQFANANGTVGPNRSILPAMPSNKLDWLVEFMQEREGTGVKVVVASSFTAIVELAATVLRKEGFEVLTLTGATSDRDRSDLVARFQDPAGSLQVVCLNRDAGGESITLDRADDMVVIDQPWISDRDEQLNARIHRVSRIHQVTIYRLVSIGTIDAWMASMNDEQRAVIAKASPRKLSEMIRGV